MTGADILESDAGIGRPGGVKLEVIADSLPALVAYVDRDLIYRYANKTFARWSAKRLDEIIGHHVRDVLGQAYFDHIRPFVERTLAGDVSSYEATLEQPGGRIMQVRSTLFPFRDPSQAVQGYFVLASDITDTRTTEEKAQRAEQRLIDAIESLSDGFVLFDAQGRLVLCNSVYRRFGASGEDVIKPGVHYRDILRANIRAGFHPEAIGREEEFIETFIKDRYDSGEDKELQVAPGRWVLMRDRKTASGDLVCIRANISGLKRREARLRMLSAAVESSPTAILVCDGKGNIEYINPKFESLFGFAPDELIGQHMRALRCDETPASVYVELERAVMSGQEWQAEILAPRKDGSSFWSKLTVAPVKSPEGEIVNILSISEDISEARAREARLRMLSAAVESSPSAVFLTDAAGIIEYVNPKFETLFGYASAEVVGKHMSILRSDQTPESVYRELWETISSGKEWQGELIATRKDGSSFWERLTAAPVFSEDGEIINYLSINEDITEAKEREGELRRLYTAVDQSPASVFITDQRARFEYVNAMFTEQTGYRPEEVIGKPISMLRSDQTSQEVYREVGEAIASGREWRGEVSTRRKDGTFFIERATVTPVKSESGEILNYLCFNEDITEFKRQENQLKVSEERFRGIYENAETALTIVDTDGAIVDANPAYCRLLGYTLDEIKRLDIADVTHPDDREESLREFADITSGRDLAKGVDHSRSLEKRLIRKDGSPVWVLLTRSVVRDADGKMVYLIGQHQDITQRVNAEEALRKSEEHNRLIVEALDFISDGIEIIEADEKFLYCNAKQREFYPESGSLYDKPGTPMEELVRAVAFGGRVHNAIGREEEWIKERLVDFRDGGNPPREFRQPDGRWLYVREHRTDNGALVCVRTDITEQKQRDQEIRQSQEQLATISANLFEGVLVLDVGGHIQFCNPAAHQLLRLPEDRNPVGSHVDTVVKTWNVEKIVDFADSPMKRSIATGEIIRNDDATFRITDGDDLEVAFACAPVSEQGTVSGCVLSFRDIKNVKAAQRESLQALKLASVGELAAGIAHEINTPSQYIGDNLRFIRESFEGISGVLTEIKELAAKLDSESANPLLVEALNKIAEKADLDFLLSEIPVAADQSLGGIEQISRIVSAMKEFSHPGAKERVPIDINQAIDSTITVSRNEWKHFAEMETDLDPDLPLVPAVSGELNQVFLNLIVNATHAIEDKDGDEPGLIKISTERLGDFVEIRISDNGCGIPEEARNKIFDPFFTTKEVGRGSGQGLAICHDVVVNKHHGSISVESRPGAGATFTIMLPAGGPDSLAEIL